MIRTAYGVRRTEIIYRRLWVALLFGAVGCSSTTPTSPFVPPTVKITTAPVIRSITAPTARVEAGQDFPISAVVEDVETPLNALSFVWSANAGRFTGTGPAVTWRHDPGLKAQFLGIHESNDPTKRLLVVINYNNDLGDYMEWSAQGWWPVDITNEAYKFVINYIVYGLTH